MAKQCKAKNDPASSDSRDAIIDATCLACHLAPSWPALAEKIKQGTLDKTEAREGIVQTWREFFNRVAKGTTDPADVQAAIDYWRQWPKLYRLHLPDAPRSWKPACSAERILALGLCHSTATRIIVQAAEQAGLDGSSIAISGQICRQALGQAPQLGDMDYWPECLNAVRTIEGPAENMAAICEEAKRTMIRLEARLSADAGEWSRKMTLTEMAYRVNGSEKTWRSFKQAYKDRLKKCGHKQWQIRLDGLAAETRQALTKR